MTRYAVARGPGPFFLRELLASPAPARPPPPPFPFDAAIAAAAAMSSAGHPLSSRKPHRPDWPQREGGGKNAGEAERRPRGGARDNAHGGRHLGGGQRRSRRFPPLREPPSPPPSWNGVITAAFALPRITSRAILIGQYCLWPCWAGSLFLPSRCIVVRGYSLSYNFRLHTGLNDSLILSCHRDFSQWSYLLP